MITNEQSQGNYNTAREALNRIIRSNSATEEERQRAEKQRDDLILNYVGRQIDDVHERSSAYVTFIKAMAAFIEDLGPHRSLEGLQTLQGIVNQAAILVKSIQEKEQRRKSDQGKS